MKLTTKGRYAVTALLDLSLHTKQSESPVSLVVIAKRQGLSLSYLEQLFTKLRSAKIVSSVRGPGGGYQLGKPASNILIADVISCVDGPVDVTKCKGGKNCRGDKMTCLSHSLWEDLSQKIHGFLSSITLEDITNNVDAKILEESIETP